MNAVSSCKSSPLEADSVAKLLKAAGDLLRLQILAVLSKNAFGVLELCQIFAIKQSGMSHHLKLLASAGLLATRREANTIFYRRSDEPMDDALTALRQSVFSAADQIQLSKAETKRLQALFAQRADIAKQFFIDNADAFKEQQDLIAEFSVYGPEVGNVLEASEFPEMGHALEVGPGSGDFLPSLSRNFEKVTALDVSQAMLDQSQVLCRNRKVKNVEFVLGDTNYCAERKSGIDCVVINMVLHHTPSPSQIFEDVYQGLKPGGVMIVCELNQHDQDWVKDACGDLWLGFASNELKGWANAVGLQSQLDRYFALRNGFQIQIHKFLKT